MNGTFTHTGIIERVSAGKASVRILQASACGECAAAKLCRSSESKEKLIDAYLPVGASFSEGDAVTLVGTVRQSTLAVVLAYVIPLVLMLAVLCGVTVFTASEMAGGAAALGVLAAYYVVLYAFRERLSRRLYFRIERTDPDFETQNK